MNHEQYDSRPWLRGSERCGEYVKHMYMASGQLVELDSSIKSDAEETKGFLCTTKQTTEYVTFCNLVIRDHDDLVFGLVASVTDIKSCVRRMCRAKQRCISACRSLDLYRLDSSLFLRQYLHVVEDLNWDPFYIHLHIYNYLVILF
jgi:hypothetical protein